MTPQVKSLGLATMMNVVENERKVPIIRTQLSSLLHALTTGVFQYLHNMSLSSYRYHHYQYHLHNTPEAMVVITKPVPAKNSAPRAQGFV